MDTWPGKRPRVLLRPLRVPQGGSNSLPHTGGAKNNRKLSVSQFWKLEARHQGVSRATFSSVPMSKPVLSS